MLFFFIISLMHKRMWGFLEQINKKHLYRRKPAVDEYGDIVPSEYCIMILASFA